MSLLRQKKTCTGYWTTRTKLRPAWHCWIFNRIQKDTHRGRLLPSRSQKRHPSGKVLDAAVSPCLGGFAGLEKERLQRPREARKQGCSQQVGILLSPKASQTEQNTLEICHGPLEFREKSASNLGKRPGKARERLTKAAPLAPRYRLTACNAHPSAGLTGESVFGGRVPPKRGEFSSPCKGPKPQAVVMDKLLHKPRGVTGWGKNEPEHLLFCESCFVGTNGTCSFAPKKVSQVTR